jgi:hypothetical protein
MAGAQHPTPRSAKIDALLAPMAILRAAPGSRQRPTRSPARVSRGRGRQSSMETAVDVVASEDLCAWSNRFWPVLATAVGQPGTIRPFRQI